MPAQALGWPGSAGEPIQAPGVQPVREYIRDDLFGLWPGIRRRGGGQVIAFTDVAQQERGGFGGHVIRSGIPIIFESIRKVMVRIVLCILRLGNQPEIKARMVRVMVPRGEIAELLQVGLRRRYYRVSGADAYTMRRDAL